MEQADRRFDRRSLRTDASAWSLRSRGGMVVCAHYLAADAGAEILAAGGNAADAAIATALALNVCEPAASGLGGMAMAIVDGFGDGPPSFLAGACTAPAAATPEAIRGGRRYRGYESVAVPGAVALWSALHTRHGCLPLRDVVRPALALARGGYPLTPAQRRLAVTYQKGLHRGNAGSLWLEESGEPKPIGTWMRQEALANTIEQLGEKGLMDFYRGDVAREIHADMQANDGFLAAADLAGMVEPTASAAIQTRFGGGTLFTSGPPAGGLALAQLAAMSNALGRPLDLRETDDVILLVEMIRRVRSDRRAYRLDIGATSLGAAGELYAEKFADRAMGEIAAALGGELNENLAEDGETTHLCVMDKTGATVSMTASLERSFGAARMSPRLGFLYNGYLRGFKIENQSHPHYLRPGVPARSNAAPTIVIGDDGSKTAIGSTGSERMVSSIFEALLRLPHEGPFAAVAAPRLHCSPEGEVMAELDRFSAATQKALTARYRVTNYDPYDFKFGGLQLARKEGEWVTGVGEPRRDGGAAAPPDATSTQ